MIRLTLRNWGGHEIGAATADAPEDAIKQALVLLSGLAKLEPGDTLSVDDAPPVTLPGGLISLTPGNLKAVIGRLEDRAEFLAQVYPLIAADLQIAAKLCRHAVKAGWMAGETVEIES